MIFVSIPFEAMPYPAVILGSHRLIPGNATSKASMIISTPRNQSGLEKALEQCASASSVGQMSQRLSTTIEAVRRLLATRAHLRPRQGVDPTPRTHPAYRRRSLLLRSPQPVAGRHLREHQWAASTVAQPRRTRQHRRQHERPTGQRMPLNKPLTVFAQMLALSHKPANHPSQPQAAPQ